MMSGRGLSINCSPIFEQGDKLWRFDEPAPPGINSGAIGIAVVRRGQPIRTAVTAIH
jgi:hypothetical protein